MLNKNRTFSEIDLSDVFFLEDNKTLDIKLEQIEYLDKGKKMRASVCREFGDILGISSEKSSILSRVVEMIHNATLIHDDVIDKSEQRRSSKTLHQIIDNRKTILFGDYVLAKALNELSTLNEPYLVTEISECLRRLVLAEWDQYQTINPFEFSMKNYFSMASNKTGTLFAWALLAPYSLFSSNLQEREVIRSIGENLGIAFQIQDDLMDFNPNSIKTSYLDFKNNNPNVVFSFTTQLTEEQKKLFLIENDFEKLSLDMKKKIQDSIYKAEKLFLNKIDEVETLIEEIRELSGYSFNNFFESLIFTIKNRAY